MLNRLGTAGVVVLALMAGLTTTAAADTVRAGPCEFNLDHPHVSTQEMHRMRAPVIRVHVWYRCYSDVLYANAQITLYMCDSAGQDTSTCVSVGSGQGQNSLSAVNYGSGYKSLAVADSDPYPSSGWYTAKAVYEVCLLNGGAIPAYGSSAYAQYNAETSKFEAVWTPLRDIDPPPL